MALVDREVDDTHFGQQARDALAEHLLEEEQARHES